MKIIKKKQLEPPVNWPLTMYSKLQCWSIKYA